MRAQLALETDITVLKIEEAASPGDPDWKTVNPPSALFPKFESPSED